MQEGVALAAAGRKLLQQPSSVGLPNGGIQLGLIPTSIAGAFNLSGPPAGFQVYSFSSNDVKPLLTVNSGDPADANLSALTRDQVTVRPVIFAITQI